MIAQTQQAAPPQNIFEGKEHQLHEYDSDDEEQQQSLLEEDEQVVPHQSQLYAEEDDAGGLLDLD